MAKRQAGEAQPPTADPASVAATAAANSKRRRKRGLVAQVARTPSARTPSDVTDVRFLPDPEHRVQRRLRYDTARFPFREILYDTFCRAARAGYALPPRRPTASDEPTAASPATATKSAFAKNSSPTATSTPLSVYRNPPSTPPPFPPICSSSRKEPLPTRSGITNTASPKVRRATQKLKPSSSTNSTP